MAEKVRKLFQRFFNFFYRTVEAEYIRFASHNEFLIRYQRTRFPFLPLEHTICERSIGYKGGVFFEQEVKKLKDQGVAVKEKVLSNEEFDSYAGQHRVLRHDPWFKRMRSIAPSRQTRQNTM